MPTLLMLKILSLMRYLAPLLFFIFICWIIYMANFGIDSIFSKLVDFVPLGDKLGHIFLYGILTLLINISINFKRIKIRNISIMFGTIFVTSFALVEEFSQYYFPTRTLDITDIIADFIGIFLFTFISIKLEK